ncbi:MAG: 16S rRNA (uracil(1498)-N(3))-methyltransferase [Desulfobulbus propionicus]|nr:MAG: 16S rRNA (uracil(1498)-N(3))-methyltransferase [Desulfobulbus propionicus]
MNLLLFDQGEVSENQLCLSGRRARHLLNVLRVTLGETVRVGQVNGPTGTGRVAEIGKGYVLLELSLGHRPVCDLHLELVLALPRPIMLQRVLKQATVLGVRRFYLIRSRRVEKSFFQSPVLKREKIDSLLREGMEQGMDTWLPEVSLHHHFKPFVQDVAPMLQGEKIIAHPGSMRGMADLLLSPHGGFSRLVLAVGPEGGWNDFELEMFVKNGFQPFSMGRRILHVDSAVVALIAQLQLLYDVRVT